VLDDLPYQFLADVVLVLHFSVAAFVVGGLVLVIVGNLGNWRWVNAFWFRLAHLGAIATIAAEAWLGAICPLTALEMWLRAKAHAGTYGAVRRALGPACPVLRGPTVGFRARLFAFRPACWGDVVLFAADPKTPRQGKRRLSALIPHHRQG